jgi:hypothetical protein
MRELDAHPVAELLARIWRIATVETRDEDPSSSDLFDGTMPSAEAGRSEGKRTAYLRTVQPWQSDDLVQLMRQETTGS